MKDREINKISFGNWPIPEEVCTELGRMHSLWNTMENTLLMLIGKLAGFKIITDMRAHILLNNTSFQQKLEILSTLCDYLKNKYPHLSNYSIVISKLKSAQKQRNILTHQLIVYDVENQKLELATSKTRGKLKTNVRKFNIAEIKRTTILIDEANVAVYELILKRKLKPVWERIVSGEKKV